MLSFPFPLFYQCDKCLMVSFLLHEGSWLSCQYFQPLERFLVRAWLHWFELLQCRCIRHPTTISHTVYTVASPWRVFGPSAFGKVLFGFTLHIPFMLRPTSSSLKLPVTLIDFFLNHTIHYNINVSRSRVRAQS